MIGLASRLREPTTAPVDVPATARPAGRLTRARDGTPRDAGHRRLTIFKPADRLPSTDAGVLRYRFQYAVFGNTQVLALSRRPTPAG